MPDLIMGDAELGNTKQELIAALVQKELASKALLGKFFTDVSVYAVPGAKTISFPKLSSFTAVNRAEGTAGTAAQLTSGLDTMLLDQNAYVAWIIDSMTKKQANIPAELESAKRAASAQARYFEAEMIARVASICSHFINVGADVAPTYDNTLTLTQKIEEAHVQMSDCVWIASPAKKNELMKLDEFKRADIYGVANIPTGVIGFIHGAPVVVHSALASKQLFLAHKESVAYGFQSAPEFDEQKANEYGAGATRACVEQLFGTVGQQLGVGGAAAGKSPLVVGLND